MALLGKRQTMREGSNTVPGNSSPRVEVSKKPKHPLCLQVGVAIQKKGNREKELILPLLPAPCLAVAMVN